MFHTQQMSTIAPNQTGRIYHHDGSYSYNRFQRLMGECVGATGGRPYTGSHKHIGKFIMTDKPKFNPAIHHRRSIRLAGYDYSRAGAYFLTLCAHHHKNIFVTIVDDRIELNACGRIVHNEWLKSAKIRWEIELDEFIIMPDHLHGIVIIHDVDAYDRRGDRPVAPTEWPIN